MSLVSFTQLQDGVTSVNAASVNTPLSTIYNDYNGNINDANIASNAAIAANKLAGGVAGMFGAWTNWTPTITAGSGTFTATTATGRYIQIGKTVIYKLDIVITTVGTGSGAVLFTLPVTAHDTSGNIGSGREDNISGKTITAKLNTSTTQASSLNYDNTSWIAAASVGRISGSYEAA